MSSANRKLSGDNFFESVFSVTQLHDTKNVDKCNIISYKNATSRDVNH